MQIKPKLTVTLDKRKALTTGEYSGKYPVKIRATFRMLTRGQVKWKQVLYKTGVYTDEKTFPLITDFKKEPKATDRKQQWRELKKNYAKAEGILENNPFINPDGLAKQYYGAGGYENLAKSFDAYETPTVGTKHIYKCAKSSFIQYAGEFVLLAEVNEKWLNGYVAWGRNRGLSNTFISMNLRCLRSVMNRAVDDKTIPIELYPFGKRGFKIQESAGVKKAISEEDKDKILDVDDDNPEAQKAADFWKFSYYHYGLNGADIILLKFKDIKDGMITIYRAKTGTKLTIPLHKDGKKIIKKYGNKSLNPDEYVFPVLKLTDSDQSKFYKRNSFNKEINSGLKLVGHALKIKDLTWYTARHTFATIMRNKGIPVQTIQVMMGHTTERTTQIYLGSITIEQLRKAQAML